MESIDNFQEETIDPANWDDLRKTSHRVIDDMIDYIEQSSSRKVWQPIPDVVKNELNVSVPMEGSSLTDVYESFQKNILPYAMGNTHPRFWGWVCGGGSPTGMLADMMASAMNSSTSFGEHASTYVEKQVIDWTKELYGFPKSSSGILTTGASLANVIAITTARNSFNKEIRKKGINAQTGQLVMYASSETHSSLQKTVELLGIGSENLKKIPVDENYQIKIDLLKEQIRIDKLNGMIPFCIVGNAGTVNTGAIDDLESLAAIAKSEGLWFHIDGAFGAVLKLLPEYNKLLKGVELADSIAFDYHKWYYVNYDVGGVLIKDAKLHKEAFEINASYLAHHERGIISGELNYNHLGIELSRGFRALKVWMLLKEQGVEKYRRLVRQNISQAKSLVKLIDSNVQLQLMAPVPMNIVCFRFFKDGLSNEELNELNKEILMQLHEGGIAAPTFTIIKGSYVIRVANTNHRSKSNDFKILVDEVVKLGNQQIENR